MEVDELVADIIQDYMDLSDEQVFFKSQNVNAPTDGSLFCVVGVEQPQVVGIKSFYDSDTAEDVQQVSMFTTVNIDMASVNEGAKYRNYEVWAALESIPGQQAMNENKMRVFRQPTILDLSDVEGSSSLHRYRISVIVSSMKELRKSTDSIYDKFSSEVNNE